MPSKNTVKDFAVDQYYHVYNRGVEKRVIFIDDQDYRVFIGLLKKYLNGEVEAIVNNRHKFVSQKDEVQLLAFCLMPNHFHLMLYQKSDDGISKFMRRLATGYAMYFNSRYHRVGSLFQGRYKASLIQSEPYIDHITRYIHLNPEDYAGYSYSSLKYYIEPDRCPDWLNVDWVLERFDSSPQQYAEFVDEYHLSELEINSLLKVLADH